MTSFARKPDHLISAQVLSGLSGSSPNDLLVADCSFDLQNPGQGYLLYQQAHIPGAIYVHLDHDLCGAKTGGNGRHPLPDRDAFIERVRELGIGNDTQVVAYDNAGGPYAARLWWLLRWIGHGKVAVLDGGLEGWRQAGYETTNGSARSRRQRTEFSAGASLVRTVNFDDVRENIASRRALVIDARAPDRFRGENETIDPVAGHIPDAVNRFFRDNLDAFGFFKHPDQLRAEFVTVLGAWNSGQVINQCGSGVTGCHNLLAMEIAGLGDAALYPGSWSEWVAQPGAPVATTTAR
ncbi:sulfurtransferase [Dechloromonas denitrificans]|uniref:sulfurtransferase n=1 Tax=Dechloromonas denitrificans TaxID=281362 RepID=UPI001CF986D5|nr:sulfurtransferase [Dechloromonas denitrificans]UCV06407.1 sulfurtransferase [Dechloromonas denitrificans]